jgi:hypothetical protein
MCSLPIGETVELRIQEHLCAIDSVGSTWVIKLLADQKMRLCDRMTFERV